ncbi:polymer-forming cytoskeletal protein [Thermococcus sp.]|uniref:polymer-forming cytoskeletal protein n=1 Tax=Thermococcus sp. TaxID=35749 RepID=UPI00262A44EE|nr:polymer-forming cytoskeletal protein [Thermococcus sp.]
MRRAQLLSVDALMATVMVILLISMVSASSENLKSGITGLIEWYERSNAPDTMLDVLLKSPGVPPNWDENVSIMITPGLRSNYGNYLDYKKLDEFLSLAQRGDRRLVSFLRNLSLGRNFKLEILLNEEQVNFTLNYLPQHVNWSALCNVKDIVNQYGNPADQPLYLYCSSGSVRFTHSGVNYNTFTDESHICVNASMYVGNNFKVIAGEYVGVSDDLTIKSKGGLNASEIYVGGDGTIESNAHVYSSGDLTIGGALYAKADAHLAVGGSAYLNDTVNIGNSAYMNIVGDFYARGPLLIHSNGHLTVGGTAYVDDYASVESRGYVTVGEDFSINGDLRTDYNAYISVGGALRVNGDSTVKGSVNATEMYVNGSLTIDSGSYVIVHRDLYVNGDLSVSGHLIVDGNLYVNGNVGVESQGSVDVGGKLYLTGEIVGDETNVHADGGIYEVQHLPWDESKFKINVSFPSIGESPCIRASEGALLVNIQNVTFIHNYTANWFLPGWNGFSFVDGKIIQNMNLSVVRSIKSSEWVTYSERKAVVRKLVYTSNYTISGSVSKLLLYSGKLSTELSGYPLLFVYLPNETGNFSLVSTFKNETSWGYGIVAVSRTQSATLYFAQRVIHTGSGESINSCEISINENRVVIPWECLFPLTGKVSFSVWAYNVNFDGNIRIVDDGNIGAYLEPIPEVAIIKLWVWGI